MCSLLHRPSSVDSDDLMLRNMPQRVAHGRAPLGAEPNTMETLTKLQVMKTENEVRGIIAELDVALFFLDDANASSDKQHQGRLIYAHIAHQAAIRLLPTL